MKHSKLRRRALRSVLPIGLVLVASLGSSACEPTRSTCDTYASLLCEKAGSESPQCQAIKRTTDLMPPRACAAGLKDVEYTASKIASVQKPCKDVVQKVCAAIGPETHACKSIATNYFTTMMPERCESMAGHLSDTVAMVQKMDQAD